MTNHNIQFQLTKKKLRYWLSKTDDLFADFRQFTLDGDDLTMRRVFIDRNSDVLFVAHLDTVCTPRLGKYGKKRVYAAGLDDRLGALIASELSEKLGADLLLTDLEENCMSTALYHDCKKYNWIAEFDRDGGDAVTYDLDNKDFRDALDCYFKPGFGSYSDICSLDTAACCVNIGIGYKKAHNKRSYVVLKTMYEQVNAFIEFFVEHKSTAFEREKLTIPVRGAYNLCDLYDYEDDLNICELCGYDYGVEIYGRRICQGCFEYMYSKEITESELELRSELWR